MANSLKILVFLGSNRPNRNGERVARYAINYLKNKGHTVTLADSKALGLPLLECPIHFFPDPSKAPQPVIDLDNMVQDAEAFVVVTGEYNRKMPAAITNLLDHPRPASFAWKTSAIITYSLGPGGGSVAGMAGRQLMVELGAPPVPSMMSIGGVSKALDADGVPAEGEAAKLDEKMGKLHAQLQWYGAALKAHKAAHGVPK